MWKSYKLKGNKHTTREQKVDELNNKNKLLTWLTNIRNLAFGKQGSISNANYNRYYSPIVIKADEIMHKIRSSNIKSINYNKANEQLQQLNKQLNKRLGSRIKDPNNINESNYGLNFYEGYLQKLENQRSKYFNNNFTSKQKSEKEQRYYNNYFKKLEENRKRLANL
jgi:hypothetical protein